MHADDIELINAIAAKISPEHFDDRPVLTQAVSVRETSLLKLSLWCAKHPASEQGAAGTGHRNIQIAHCTGPAGGNTKGG